jgi:predicted hotdog family 3-hydroxylacyl-ACP dehydratase
MIERDAVMKLIPHSGSMCLIDRALSWNGDEIRCESANHGDVRHPLQRGGILSAVHLIEYGAQAAALHSVLAASAPTHIVATGFLASVRACDLHVERIDDLPGTLQIGASREVRSSEALMYRFEIWHQERSLCSGRLLIRLAPGG